jgi:predicted N-acetyltransferase YhbS
MIRYRWAQPADQAELLDLIAAGFAIYPDGRFDAKRGREHRILFKYLYSRPTWQSDWVMVGEVDRRLVAAVGFFPQQLNMGGTTVPVWAVSPVVVHPERQGQGYSGKCLTRALELLSVRGVPAVFLWGIPDFYPKFGFEPLLPRYKTRLAKDRISKGADLPPGRLRALKKTDLPTIAAIYESRASQLWLQPRRNYQWWTDRAMEMDSELADLKEVPFPKQENFLVWENFNGETAGYLYYSDPAGKDPLIINEAAAGDYNAAAAMLRFFMSQYVKDGEIIIIRGTPDHYLNLAAYRCGGTHLNPAPLAGMIKVLDWPAFWAQIKPLTAARFHEAGLSRPVTLAFRSGRQLWELKVTAAGGELAVATAATSALTEAQVTRLIFGLADAADGESLPVPIQKLPQVFPARYPFIWDANYLY